jgi:hypothetical protein
MTANKVTSFFSWFVYGMTSIVCVFGLWLLSTGFEWWKLEDAVEAGPTLRPQLMLPDTRRLPGRCDITRFVSTIQHPQETLLQLQNERGGDLMVSWNTYGDTITIWHCLVLPNDPLIRLSQTRHIIPRGWAIDTVVEAGNYLEVTTIKRHIAVGWNMFGLILMTTGGVIVFLAGLCASSHFFESKKEAIEK